MQRSCITIAVLLAATCAARAQDANPISANMKQSWNNVKGLLQRMAEKAVGQGAAAVEFDRLPEHGDGLVPLPRVPEGLAEVQIVPQFFGRELEGFPFALTEPSFGPRQQLDRVFAKYRFEPTTFCVTNSLALAKEVAGIGRQCTLLPRFAVEQELTSGALRAAVVREFADEPLVFCICSRGYRSLSPAAKVFMDIVIDYCRRYRR